MPVSALWPCLLRCFPMRPSRPPSGKSDLFRERLEAIIDPGHPLVRLVGLVPWSRFDDVFGRFYRPLGRPAKPTRLMVGLHYLKHVHDLSDEEVVARWAESLLAVLLRLRLLSA
jgi:IS5 family transposase